MRNSNAQRIVLAQQVASHIKSPLIDYRQGFHRHIEKLSSHIRHTHHIMVQVIHMIQENYQCLIVVATLEVIHLLHSFSISRVTTYAPYGIGGIQYYPSSIQHLNASFNVFVKCHAHNFIARPQHKCDTSKSNNKGKTNCAIKKVKNHFSTTFYDKNVKKLHLEGIQH